MTALELNDMVMEAIITAHKKSPIPLVREQAPKMQMWWEGKRIQKEAQQILEDQ